MDKLAIVILNWNGAKMLRQYLPGVLKHSLGQAAVYVADNASTDGSLSLLQTDKLRLWSFPFSVGNTCKLYPYGVSGCSIGR